MRTLWLDCQRPIDSKLLDPSSSDRIGGAALSINKRFAKPMREFSLKSWDTLLADQMEIIRNEVHAGRISGVFWLDGDAWGNITEPVYINDADGVQLQYPMPYDNVFAPSWKIYINGILNTGWTMHEQTGVLVFTTAPTGRITGTGKRKFRVVINENSEAILSESQIYSSRTDGVYSMNALVLMEVEGVNVA